MTVGAREATTVHAIRSGGYSGAAVWAVYGIVETAFVVIGPSLRKALVAVAPQIFPAAVVSDFVSPALTALILVLYPVVGALLGASVALVFALTTAGRLVLAKADNAVLWTSVGCLTLGVALGVIALVTHNASVLLAVLAPIAFGVLRLGTAGHPNRRSLWPGLTHPLTIVVMLVGATFIAYPRWHVTPLVQSALGIGYTAGILVLAAVLHRVWASTPVCRQIGRHVPRAWASILVLSCAVLALSVLTGSSTRAAPQTQVEPRARDNRPNVILITLDTARADHFSVYGYSRDTTPNLRRLVATGATAHTRAIASSNWTLPEHASIFTGQSPRLNGAHESSQEAQRIYPISANAVTLAELLYQQGYRTAGIVANFGALSGGYGTDRGFSSYDPVQPKSFWSLPPAAYLLRTAVRNSARTLLDHDALYVSAETINSRAERFLDKTTGRSQPFFLFLNYMDAHAPYLPPPPFDERYPGRDAAFRWSSYDAVARGQRPFGQRQFLHLTSQYDGAIAYLDDQLERLFQKLRSLGIFENSLIIITSDHGEAFGESSLFGHGVSLYQHQVHVPLIVKYPYAATGERVDALVGGVDILPTVLDVIGAPMPPNIEGRSLRQVEPLTSRWVTSESYRSRGPGWTSKDERPTEMALFSGTLKLILGAGGGTELYDLSTDPNEHVNLFGRRVVPKEWISKLVSDMEEAGARTSARPVTDPELLDRLRALGYIR